MDSQEETSQLAPLRDVSHRSLSQRSPTQARPILSSSSPVTTSSANGSGRSKSVSQLTNANTVMLLSSPAPSSSGKDTSGGGARRANSTSKATAMDSTSDGLRDTPMRRGSSSSLLSSQLPDPAKLLSKSTSAATTAARRGSKMLFMSLVEKFVAVPENETSPGDDGDDGYSSTGISDHRRSNRDGVSPDPNSIHLPVHLISSAVSTNIIPAATDEDGGSRNFTPSGSSPIDSARRGDDAQYGSAGGGGLLKQQSKSPPQPLMSSSERYAVANNRIAPLGVSPVTIPSLDHSSRGISDIPSLMMRQMSLGISASNDEQQTEEEEESQVIIALGPGCMIGKHCLDSLLNRPGAPEWKDEILQGTLNVGSVSAITAVVPSDSTDRVQVMCLSYGFQKAIGNTMTTNGFERQIPLAEVAQNLKDEYTSSYVMHGDHNPS